MKCIWPVTGFLFVIVPSAAAQGDSATVPRALRLTQAGQHKAAAEMLATVTAREPENARAWLLLGTSRLKAGDTTGAMAATQRATTFEQTRPSALYNTGLIHGLMGHRDSAFAYLFMAKATNRVDLTQIGADPDAVGLRDDPRFQQLFPTAAEFAAPFVEPAAILREWHGEAAGDQFGWIARNAGDLDGDGAADVVTSAPTSNHGGKTAGRVYAYSARRGVLLWARDGEPGDQSGTGVEAAGDVNRDGVPDVIAGAPGGSRAYLYSGRDGSTLLTLQGEAASDQFGRHVSDLGDVNGDGHADVIVGAPANNAGGTGAGRAYVYSGRDGSLLLTLTGDSAGDGFGSTVGGGTHGGTHWILVGAGAAGPRRTGRTYVYRNLEPQPAFVIESDSTGAALGWMFISLVGDVNRDGVGDIYASDFANSAKGRSTGRIYVYSGATGAPLLTLTGENAGDGFGIGPADAGDVNGDGHDDLVIGAWQFAGAAPSGGKIYLYSGKDGSLLRTLTGKVPGETLGFDATGLGDINGDGTPDLLLTSAWSAINGTRSGRVMVVSGKY